MPKHPLSQINQHDERDRAGKLWRHKAGPLFVHSPLVRYRGHMSKIARRVLTHHFIGQLRPLSLLGSDAYF